jgi:hypothetical protein
VGFVSFWDRFRGRKAPDNDVFEAYSASLDLDEVYESTAAALYEWARCPCEVHFFYVGVQAGSAPGFSPFLVLESGVEVLRGHFAGLDDDVVLEETDLLAVNELLLAIVAGRATL